MKTNYLFYLAVSLSLWLSAFEPPPSHDGLPVDPAPPAPYRPVTASPGQRGSLKPITSTSLMNMDSSDSRAVRRSLLCIPGCLLAILVAAVFHTCPLLHLFIEHLYHNVTSFMNALLHFCWDARVHFPGTRTKTVESKLALSG
jgi:hypothetical protein